MKKLTLYLLLVFSSFQVFSQPSVRLITQFINPCGNDGSNEFIIALATSPVNIGDLGFASINHTSAITQPDFNWYWYGKNVVSAPGPTFTPSSETCGVAGSGLSCFRLMDPGTPADATVIDGVRTTLNTAAGCNVFLPVPSSGIIPGGLFVVFLGAGGCGLNSPSTNLNFSNHCSGGLPTQQYYLVVGNGAYTPATACTGGYFVNSSGTSRTSVIYQYTGGGNTNPANYQTSSSIYTNGGSPPSGNAAVIVPDGSGGSVWLNNAGCVPSPLVILAENNFSISGFHNLNGIVELSWEMISATHYDYFVLERSRNGVSFDEIKRLTKFNSTESGFFGKFIDDDANSPLLYYRVKAVSLSGKTAYSPTKILNNLGLKKIKLFPNPVQNKINIESSYNEELQIDIYNVVGKIIYRHQMNKSTVEINTENWPKGYYTLKASDRNGNVYVTNKFLKL